MSREAVREAVAVLAGALAATLVMTFPLATGIGSLARVDTSDGLFSVWNVAWVARTLVVDPLSLFDANIFYPYPGALGLSESNLVAGALAVPVFWATGNAYAAHNSVVVLSFCLSFAGAYYLARYLTGSRPAAAVAGVLFAFCPFTLARMPHVQLLMTAVLPWTLLAMHRLVDRPKPARAAALGGMLVLTAFSCGYYAVFAVILVACGCVYFLITRRWWANPAYYGAVVCAAGLALVLTWPLLVVYLRLGDDGQPFRSLEDARGWSANWAAYVAAAGYGHGWLARFSQGWTDVLFPGLITLGLVATGAVSLAVTRPVAPAAGPWALLRRWDVGVFYGLMGGVFLWLSFGPDAGLYRVAYHGLPMLGFLRAPARCGLVVTLALVVLGTLGLASLLRRTRWPRAAALGLAILALVELCPAPLRMRTVPSPALAYRMLATAEEGPVAEFPFYFQGATLHQHAYYMVHSTLHWKPLVNGYSDRFPAGFRERAERLASFPSLEAFQILRQHSTRYVVVHPKLYGLRSFGTVRERLDRFRSYLRPVVRDEDGWLFEIVAWPADQPHLAAATDLAEH